MVRINNNDPNDISAFQDDELPETFSNMSYSENAVERRPGMLFLVFAAVTAVGFILGGLFTLGILGGYIEIDPKTIKVALKTILGKS